MTEFDFFIF